MRHTADAEPGRVHTEAGNRFHQIVDFLTVGKGEEHRGHRADVLNEGGDIQQVAVDTEQLGQHHADSVDALRHLNTGQLLDRQHVRHFVHAAAEILDAVGVRNVAVPGLTLAHLLGAAVVITDVRHAVDDLFAVQLQNDAERTVRRRVVRAEVEEHEVFVLGAALHAPVFRLEGQRFHLQIFFLLGQHERIEFGGARRVVLAQRVPFPGLRHHDARQVRVAVEGDAEHFPGFALIPVGVREYLGRRGHVQVFFRQRHLQHDVAVALDGNQMVENGEIRSGQAVAVGAKTFVHAMQIEQHDIRLRLFSQERHYFQ